MKRLTLLLTLALAVSNNAVAQIVCGLGEYQNQHLQGCEHGLIGTGVDEFKFVPPPASFDPNASRDAVISVTYNGFSPAAQAAFQYAIDIWADALTSSVPILIEANYQPIGGSVLGFAGADGYFQNFPGATEPNTFYPAALANKLRGADNDITSFDLSCTFNSNTNWYLGTDGNTPGGQYDFVTVVLHELGHGLGFIGSGNVSGSQGFIGFGGSPVIYDTFVEENNGTNILTYSTGTTALGDALTGNQLYWFGPEGQAGAGGIRPRLYAPSTWNGGSSYSHLNEGTYPSGTTNALMTPFLGTAEAIHDPGPIVLGMFEDMGWTVGGCEISNITLGTQTPCNPATGTYNQQITIEYSGEPVGGLLNVNGSLFTINGSPQTVSVNNLVADGQPVDLNISFSQDAECTYFEAGAWTAPESCCQDLRITSVNPDLFRIEITNYGNCSFDISDHILSSNLSDVLISSLLIFGGGDFILDPLESVQLQWGTWAVDPAGMDMTLYVPGATFTDPDDLVDFTQWTSGGNGREAVAVAKGIWGAGDFVGDLAPFTYIGDGTQNGVTFWEGTPPPCAFTSASAGTQTACDIVTNEYTQEVTVEYISEPGAGFLTINGQNFAITGSPQTETLTGLDSDAASVDVVYFFSDLPTCIGVSNGLFTAPAICACPGDFDGSGDVTIADFLILLAEFGCTTGCTTDLDGDGSVSVNDLLILTSNFNTICP